MTRKPLDQGDEDGFCGLYAIINAITLLFPGTMNQERRDSVFKAICRAIPQHKWPGPIWNGTTSTDVRAMLGAARREMNNSFSWEQPFDHLKLMSVDEFMRELKWRIEGDDAFAVVGISKPWEHWTCAHRLTPHEMIMTDSCHVKQIPLGKCGLTGDGMEYEFDYKQTFTVMRAKS